jgi:hypothetical protein
MKVTKTSKFVMTVMVILFTISLSSCETGTTTLEVKLNKRFHLDKPKKINGSKAQNIMLLGK